MNIVSTAMNFIGPAIIDRIARSLGINSTLARAAVTTALPAIMAALSGKGSSTQGAGSILDMVRNKGENTLQNLEGIPGGADEEHHIEAGLRELDSVLGSGEMGPIMQTVSRFIGIEEQQSKSLFGVIGPVALGTLGQEVSRQNLDASGLSQMLSGQQANIAAALPDGFTDHVSGSRNFDAFRANLNSATRSTTGQTAPVPVKKSGGMLWPLLGFLALLAAGWYVFTNFMGDDEGPARTGQIPEQSGIDGRIISRIT